MTTTTPSAALIPVAPVFTNTERLALAGFLAGYSGLTREAYELDLPQYASWCHQHRIRLFQARRPDIECFARDLETRGRARATITRRLCTIAGFYRYAVEEDLLDHSPAAHVRRPRLDYESHAIGLDRNELGALLVAAGLGPPAEHALTSLLALNGLRVSEATGANIEALGVERGHRTLVITRIRAGADARFLKTSRALAHLAGGKADHTWDRRLRELTRPAVLVLDDFAMRELTAPQADDLYELISERAGKSLILTSNRAPADWYPLFPNPVVAESLLDRLINTSHQVFMNGPSYRPNKAPGRVLPTREHEQQLD
jgi:IstB-like ATP binding protein/Phage integrase, N-terminal SAM-like domain